MSRSWVLIVILVVCSLILIAFSTTFTSNPLKNVSDYRVYYGESQDSIIEQLGQYDMAIIEPHEYNTEQVTTIKKSGTITLGYISIMELEKWNKKFVEKIQDSDYYYVNHEKVYVSDWDTYIMDISKSHYRGLIMKEIEEEIIANGYQGIFLDTVGDIDDFFHDKPVELQTLRDGYIELLKEIKAKYSHLILVQNWGFDTYKSVSHPYIDGILWENFDADKLKTSEWGQNWITFFQKEQDKGHVAVFTISPDYAGKKYSEWIGFTSLINKNSIYNDWQD